MPTFFAHNIEYCQDAALFYGDRCDMLRYVSGADIRQTRDWRRDVGHAAL